MTIKYIKYGHQQQMILGCILSFLQSTGEKNWCKLLVYSKMHVQNVCQLSPGIHLEGQQVCLADIKKLQEKEKRKKMKTVISFYLFIFIYYHYYFLSSYESCLPEQAILVCLFWTTQCNLSINKYQ